MLTHSPNGILLLCSLAKPENVAKMLEYIMQRQPLAFADEIVDIGDSEETQLKAKRAARCADIFQIAARTFTGTLMQPQTLRRIFSYFDTDEVIDPAYTGAFRKLLQVLATMEAGNTIEWMCSDAEVVEWESPGGTEPGLRSKPLMAMLRHIYLHPVLETIISLGWDRPGYASRTWLCEYGFLDSLFDAVYAANSIVVQPDDPYRRVVLFRRFETHSNAFRALIDMIIKDHNSPVLAQFSKAYYVRRLLGLVHPILAAEKGQEIGDSFREFMSNLPETTGAAVALANTLSFIVLLANSRVEEDEKANQAGSPSGSKEKITMLTVNKEDGSLIQELVDKIPFFLGFIAAGDDAFIRENHWSAVPDPDYAQRLFDAGSELARFTTRPSFANPNKREVRPFGEARVKALELVSLLLRIRDANLAQTLASTHTLRLVLDLLTKYPTNNIVHSRVLSCVGTVLQSQSKPLLTSLVQDANILQWLLSCLRVHYQDPLNYAHASDWDQERAMDEASSTQAAGGTESSQGKPSRPCVKVGFLPYLNQLIPIVHSLLNTDATFKQLVEGAINQGAEKKDSQADCGVADATARSILGGSNALEQLSRWMESLRPTAAETIYSRMRDKVARLRSDTGSDDDEDYYEQLLRQSNPEVGEGELALPQGIDDEDQAVDRATIARALAAGGAASQHDDGDDGLRHDDNDDRDDDVQEKDTSSGAATTAAPNSPSNSNSNGNRVFVPSSALSVAGAWGLAPSSAANHDEDDEDEIGMTIVANTNLTRSASGSLPKPASSAIPASLVASSSLDDDDDDPFSFAATPVTVKHVFASQPEESDSDENDSAGNLDSQHLEHDPDHTDSDEDADGLNDFDPYNAFANNGLVMNADQLPISLVRSSSLGWNAKSNKNSDASKNAGEDASASAAARGGATSEESKSSSTANVTTAPPSSADPFDELVFGNFVAFPESAYAAEDPASEEEGQTPSGLANPDSEDDDGTSLHAVAELMARHSDPAHDFDATSQAAAGGKEQGQQSIHDANDPFADILTNSASEMVHLSANNLDDLANAASTAVNALMTQAAVESTWCGEDPFE